MSDTDLLNKWRDLAGQKFRPLQASLELTNRCNERCTHCYIDKFADDLQRVLSFQDWEKILQELRGAGSLYLILMGGEAMLNPHFWDILRRGAELGFHCSMITNGLLIQKPEVAERLAHTGLSVATVSLYSLDPAIHDRMTRVPGSCEKTKTAIELLLGAGIQVGVNCLLSKENVESYFELEDWCHLRGLEIKADTMITPKLSGNMKPTLQRMSAAQAEWYFEARAKKWKRGNPQPVEEGPRDHICNVAKGKCAVTAYGELLTCIEVREPLGSLVENSFNELWQGAVAKKWRDLKIEDIQNRPSDSSAKFCDHCPGMARNEHGNELRISDYALEQARIKKAVYEKYRSPN